MPTLSAADRPTLDQLRARAARGRAAALVELRRELPTTTTPSGIVLEAQPRPANRVRRSRERYQHFHPWHFTESNRELQKRTAELREMLADFSTDWTGGRWVAYLLKDMHMRTQLRARQFMRALSRWSLPGCVRVLPHFPSLAGRRFLLHEVREVLPTALCVIVRRVIAPGAPHAAVAAAPCV